MKVIYRISDAGYSKVKPDYIDNDKCLNNFTSIFDDVQIIADNCCDETLMMIIIEFHHPIELLATENHSVCFFRYH